MMLLIFPILLLVTAIGCFRWYQYSHNDIFRALALAIALIGIIWVLTVSHWTIQLLSLLVLLKFYSPVLSPVRIKINNK
jgi:hypothetical protein